MKKHLLIILLAIASIINIALLYTNVVVYKKFIQPQQTISTEK